MGSEGEQDAAADRSQAFVAVQGAVEEDVPGGPLMVGAYAVVLTVLVLYVIRLTRLQNRVASDMKQLSSVLKQAGGDSGDG